MLKKFFKQLFCRHLAFTFVGDYVIKDTNAYSCFAVKKCTACDKLISEPYEKDVDEG